MSIITARVSKTPLYATNEFFSVLAQQERQGAYIIMYMHVPFVNTKDIPSTYNLLSKKLPSVLKSQCFNDKHLPFGKEVRQTEFGHLFEHVLLEYLCILRSQDGSDAVFSGVTDWNWYQDPRGTFHITIHSGMEHADIFPKAFEKTKKLMELLLITHLKQ